MQQQQHVRFVTSRQSGGTPTGPGKPAIRPVAGPDRTWRTSRHRRTVAFATCAAAAVIALAGCTDIVVYGDSLTVQSAAQIQSNARRQGRGRARQRWHCIVRLGSADGGRPGQGASEDRRHRIRREHQYLRRRRVGKRWRQRLRWPITKLRSEPSGKLTRQNGSLLSARSRRKTGSAGPRSSGTRS